MCGELDFVARSLEMLLRHKCCACVSVSGWWWVDYVRLAWWVHSRVTKSAWFEGIVLAAISLVGLTAALSIQ